MFLPANEPHAYISGDCMECAWHGYVIDKRLFILAHDCVGMACSDNVVRAGSVFSCVLSN